MFLDKERGKNGMALERPQEIRFQGCFHPLNLPDKLLECLVVGGGELGCQGTHAILDPIQGRFVVRGGDAVEPHIDADDLEKQSRRLLVIGGIGPFEPGHFDNVSGTGVVIEGPKGLFDGGRE